MRFGHGLFGRERSVESSPFHPNSDIFRLGSRLNVCRWMFRNDWAAEWDIEIVGIICKRMQQ
jgi:hypothetical protein